jgi:hypothetical protein
MLAVTIRFQVPSLRQDKETRSVLPSGFQLHRPRTAPQQHFTACQCMAPFDVELRVSCFF